MAKVSRFPKEFKKKKLGAFDWRFIVILMLSAIFQIGLVLFLKAHLPYILQARQISQIQQQYASLVLDRDQDLEQYLPTESLDSRYADLLTTGTTVAPEGPPESPGGGTAGGSAAGGAGGGAAGSGGGYSGSAESRLPTVGEMGQGGGAGGRVRGRNLSDVIGDVGNVGLLGVLTAGSGVIEGEYITSITNFGDMQGTRLSEALAGLDAMRVTRGPGGKGWGEGAGGNKGNPAGTRITGGSRGDRRVARALDVDDLIGTLQPQGQVEFGGIGRTHNFENVGAGAGDRPATPVTPEEKERLRRTPDYVMAIVNAHRPAIIDCYKSLLRNSPNLKGKVEVRFAVDPEGRVTWAEIIDTSIRIERLQNCVLTRIRNWNDFGYGDPTSADEVYRQVFTFGY